MRASLRRVVFPLVIFAWACALRVVFFAGFVLCDDTQEFATCIHVLAHGPMLNDQFHLRFGVWLLNVAVFRLLGPSEFAFFLPVVAVSASFGVIAYAILRRWGRAPVTALFGGLMFATAPFEVLIGTLRANDLLLAWTVALALWALVALDGRPVVAGIVVAVLGWFGFYVKLWAVYFLPALGVFYLVDVLRRGRWRGAVAFVLASAVVHGATCFVWKRLLDDWIPFIHNHAATYPIPWADLPALFRVYPGMVLHGSEFGTTLFGIVPYLVGIGLAAKLAGSILRRWSAPGWRMDARDWALLGCWGSFFLLLEFFPNAFVFDRYYSAPRIFRYMAPMSFPLTLHLAKMVGDLVPRRPPWLAAAALLALTAWNFRDTAVATGPTRAYRETLQGVIAEVHARRPPMLVADAWTSFFLSQVYLKDIARDVQVMPVNQVYSARDHEVWLGRHQTGFRPGTLLLTGIGSCVHYGAHRDGFRLALFAHELDGAWKVVKEYPPLAYVPVHEPVRLWQLTEPIRSDGVAPAVHVEDDGDPEHLFALGMKGFDGGRCDDAQPYFDTVLARHPGSERAEDAAYFRAICFFRDHDWRGTIDAFQSLIRDYPNGRWVAGAYYHIGLCDAELHDAASARTAFETVRDRFSQQDSVVRLARERLAEMDAQKSVLERTLGWLGLR